MKLRSCWLIALLPALVAAQSVKVEKYKLPNGLTVILHEDHSQPIACVNVWYKVGSKDEPERRSGFAHLFEHLMFMGTKRVPNGQFDTLMEKFGGSNNASTSEDRTNYFESGPASILPTLLWLEADRLEGLALDMDQNKLDLQREVVKNERRQSVENAPYGKAYDAMNGIMFPKGHPYHTTVIGSMEDLDNAAVRDVKDFFNTFYVVNNASMVVAGDFDSKTIKPLIAKLFGGLQRGNDIVRKSVPPIQFQGVKRTTMVDQVEAPKTIMVWHSPAAYKTGDVEMRLTGGILAGGYTSQLYQSIVVEKQLASDVSAYQMPLLLGSMFMVEATAREGVSLDKLEKGLDEALAKFRKAGPTQAELSRQIAQIGFHSINGLQSVTERADKLNEYEFYFGDPNGFAKDLAQYQKAKTDAIRQVAAKVLDPNSRLILRVIPQGKASEGNVLDQQPANLAVKPFTFPKATEFKLSNGIVVKYWQRSDLPLTSLTIRLASGSTSDAPEKSGLSQLTADMADEGAGKLDAEQFTNVLDQLGAQLEAGADQTGTTLSLTSLTTNFGKALPLLADTILKPRLAKEDWNRVKSLHLESLQNEASDPNSTATRIANREFFGIKHPYSRPVDGSIATVTKLALPDVQAKFKSVFRPANAAIFASGSLPVADLKAQLEKNLGAWKSADKKPATKFIAPNPTSSKQRVIVVDKPGAVQTVIRIMMPTAPFDSPSRYALTELGVAFGGTFTSRINRKLREEKGYTYGAGLRFAFSKSVSYTSANTSVRTDVTGASLKEIIAEFARISTGDITDDEAAKARNTVFFDAISSIGTRQGLISTAIAYSENGIALNAVGTELAKFAAVTTATLNDLAKSEAMPFEKAIIVLVGDKTEILKQIEGLGLAEPEVVKGG